MVEMVKVIEVEVTLASEVQQLTLGEAPPAAMDRVSVLQTSASGTEQHQKVA